MVKNQFDDAEIDCYNYDIIFPTEPSEKVAYFLKVAIAQQMLQNFLHKRCLELISILCAIFLQILMIVAVYLFSIKKGLVLEIFFLLLSLLST